MLKVLIAHKDEKIAATLARQIRYALRLEVECLKTFASVKEALAGGGYDYFLAVVDLTMPEAGGGEFFDFLNSKRVPSLAVASDVSDGVREFVVSNGLLDYAVIHDSHDIYYIVSFIERLYKNRSVKVLVVDDSPTSRLLTTHILTTFGFQIFEAESGKKALAIYNENPDIKLIITDYIMPDMDGVEIIRKIRRGYGKSAEEVSIIGVSAYGSSVLAAKFLKNGANELLTKPFLREEFITRIHQNLAFLENYQTIKRLSEIDNLTGLSNRRSFFEQAARAYDDARRDENSIALAMIDIDRFKAINDIHGHSAGDAVIKGFGSVLAESFRSVDTVGRVEGEEFCVLAVGMKQEAVEPIFEAVRQKTEELSIEFGDKKLTCTISLGLATGSFDSLEDMIAHADTLLYRAKNEGRNRIIME